MNFRLRVGVLFGFIMFAAVLHGGEPVVWNPLGKVEREADTLLLADFTSAATIEAQGGYLLGLYNDWTKKAPVVENYEFGPGRSGRAIRGKETKPDTGAYSFVQFALSPRIARRARPKTIFRFSMRGR